MPGRLARQDSLRSPFCSVTGEKDVEALPLQHFSQLHAKKYLSENDCRNRRWSIFRLQRSAFQTVRPIASHKKRGFPLTSGRESLCAASRFLFFKDKTL